MADLFLTRPYFASGPGWQGIVSMHRLRLTSQTFRCLSDIKMPMEVYTSAVSVPQAPDRAQVWSKRQRPREQAIKDPRFVGIDLSTQPFPPAAIELLKKQSITLVKARSVECDGGGLLGHPNVFINLVIGLESCFIYF